LGKDYKLVDGEQNYWENVKKLRDIVKRVKVAMLTTVTPEGHLRSRPMMPQKLEFDGDLWFFTRVDSVKVDEICQYRQVNVSYAEPGEQVYLSVSGTAQLVRDWAQMNELWDPIYETWFPEGLDDPELALIKVNVDQAEYWDAPTNALVQWAGLARAVITGRRYNEGQFQQIKLHN
jgi:general stress protein 26